MIKYGYSPDLSYDEICGEFRRRYDQAQLLQQQEAGFHRLLLLIEGMPEHTSEVEASGQRAQRNVLMQRLCEESSFGATELDILAEQYAARLEADWIRQV